jgi:hypothetical protein
MYLYFVAFKTIEHGGFGNIIISLDEEITSKNFKNSYLTMIETIEHEMKCSHIAIISYQLIPDENTEERLRKILMEALTNMSHEFTDK